MESIDQTGRRVQLKFPPKRIISLVPSQSELLSYLGLDQEVIGITKFCVHPEDWFRSKIRVGGTKTVKIELIHELQPDLIIANKEENTKGQILELKKTYPVWISDIKTLEDALEMIQEVGTITNRSNESQKLVADIQSERLQIQDTSEDKPRVAYLIWNKPLMGVGTDTYIHNFMEAMDFKNALSAYERYPELTLDRLREAEPDHIFLSSEPFPFKNKHKRIFSNFIPEENVHLVDGEMFSWYGNKILQGIQYARMLHRSIVDIN